MDLLWDDANRTHIARHSVRPEEVHEAVSNSAALSERDDSHRVGRIVVRSITAGGRHLVVVLDTPAAGRAYVITARPMNQPGTHQVAGGSIMTEPRTDPLEAERDYYDSHEFLGDGEPVQLHVAPGGGGAAYLLDLDRQTVKALRAIAAERNINEVQLLHHWVEERVAMELHRPAGTDPEWWDRARTAVEELLPELVARISTLSG